MTARLTHEGAATFVTCKPCDLLRHEPNRAVAMRLVTEHNHTKHKEAT